MMKGRSGEVLWDDTIRLGIELRKKLRAVRREFEEKERDPARRWFFEPFVPDRVAIPDVAQRGRVARRAVGERVDRSAGARPALLGARARRGLARLHRMLEPGFAITDPNKLTLLTPGFDRETGAYADARRSGAGGRAISAREPRRAGEERPQLAAVPAHARASNRARPARLSQRAGRVQAAARRQRAARRRDAGIRRRGGRRAIAACGCATSAPRCTPSSATADVSALQRAQFRAEHLPEMAMTPREAVAPSGAQQCRLCADRRDRRPHRHDAVRRLSAGHRDHRAGRAARTRARGR